MDEGKDTFPKLYFVLIAAGGDETANLEAVTKEFEQEFSLTFDIKLLLHSATISRQRKTAQFLAPRPQTIPCIEKGLFFTKQTIYNSNKQRTAMYGA
ncbi:MAG: hypothetical protein FWC16_12060 [Defluviitaleaceae bacterium]|nr:hypothetical protein [Defluviitaleaceae bacterium]MCL2275653.1 hypothetical protein [Defluviitaleaceae bacterium]